MRESIIKKLLLLLIASLALTMSAIQVVSNSNLRTIIDESQSELYREKLDVIWFELMTYEERLDRTGLRSAYLEDFQKSAAAKLERTYYGENLKNAYPFIIDRNRRIILHPVLSGEESREGFITWTERILEGDSGEFDDSFEGVKKWYAYKLFEPWDWVLCYTIPLKVKYRDFYSFRIVQMAVILGFSAFQIFLTAFILTRFLKPVKILTAATQAMAEGTWSSEIPTDRRDELGILAKRFKEMQESIREKMDDLTKARGFISDIIESMPSAIISLDGDGRITQMNHLAQDLLGASLDRAKDSFLWEVSPSMERETQKIFESLRDGGIHRIPSIHLGDTTRFFDVVLYPLENEAAGGIVLRIDDVTEKKKMDDQLVQFQKMDALGQLVGGVAHDFNNMLGGIVAAAELMERSLPHEGRDRELMDVILDASGRASDLVANLLSFSRRRDKKFSTHDLHRIIYQTVSLLRRTLDKSIEISVETCAGTSLFLGSETRVENLIMNMVINASHAMPGGGRLTIATKNIVLDEDYCIRSPFEVIPGRFIDLEISDTGTGIPPETLDRIFEPFFTTKERGRGTGLGLASVFGTVQEHGGVINVKSEMGTGTVFNVCLPCAEDETAVPSKEEVTWRGSGTVLLVDDEDIIRRTASMILSEMGLRVITAADGIEALDIFKAKRGEIDLVITDMIMPRMGGRELVEELRKIEPNAKVVISSGFARDDDLEQLKKRGVEGFLQKPFSRGELAQMMEEVLSGE